MAKNPRIGDVGTVFKLTIKDQAGAIVNISGASTKVVRFRKPDATVVEKAGALYSDGTDGILKYTTIAGDLDKGGSWSIQAKVVLASGTWYSTTAEFVVETNLDVTP